MLSRTNRRSFIKKSGAVAAGFWLGSAPQAKAVSANEKLNVACIGVGGKGGSDSDNAAQFGNVVAICDVDQRMLDNAARRYPNAKRYTDWRKMLEQKDIDAVTVSTADHTHAPVSMSAIPDSARSLSTFL